MRSMAPFNPYFYTAQQSYQQMPQTMQAYLPMNFPQQNVYSPYLAMQNNQLQNNMYHSYEPQGPMPMKKVKLEPTEPVKAATYIHNQDKRQQQHMMPQNQMYNTAPEPTSADSTDSSAGNSPPENITKEVDNFEIGELKMPPVLDQEDLFSDVKNTRATYHEFFTQMEEAMKASWAKQLEFLELLKKLNKPELAMRNPVLDKVNPLIAGVMSKKAKIDENTLTVMKRTHKLLKAGPAVRTTTPKYKIPLEKNLVGKRMINTGMVKEEFEAPFTSNFARKTALKAKVKENEETTDQLMAFILQGCNAGKTGNEKL